MNSRLIGLGLGPILRVAHNSELTRFEVIIDFGLERFYAHWRESERNVKKTSPVAKSMCESFLGDWRLLAKALCLWNVKKAW